MYKIKFKYYDELENELKDSIFGKIILIEAICIGILFALFFYLTDAEYFNNSVSLSILLLIATIAIMIIAAILIAIMPDIEEGNKKLVKNIAKFMVVRKIIIGEKKDYPADCYFD